MIESENDIEIYNMGLIFRVSTIDALLCAVLLSLRRYNPKERSLTMTR